MKFGFQCSGNFSGLDYVIHVVILPLDFDHNPIYFFDITPDGFNHMFGEIDEYPLIEYVERINKDDEDDHQDGRLKIIGMDIL